MVSSPMGTGKGEASRQLICNTTLFAYERESNRIRRVEQGALKQLLGYRKDENISNTAPLPCPHKSDQPTRPQHQSVDSWANSNGVKAYERRTWPPARPNPTSEAYRVGCRRSSRKIF